LQRQKYGPIIPVHECPGWSQWTHASSEFRHCFNREPVEGDLLRWEHVRAMRGPEINEIKFGDQIEAWQRQLPQLPCPLKFEEGRLFKRQRNGDWFEAVDVSWRARAASGSATDETDSTERSPSKTSLRPPKDQTLNTRSVIGQKGAPNGYCVCLGIGAQQLCTPAERFFLLLDTAVYARSAS
jgi:hypothetical protein